ncbi:hypothetical protein GGS24DRAFT_504842 [Hypoxylon argillaceum]|nr:hypothetical protein GGS24DRAFT_504842 [Hypoxylon argillaceum]
MEDTSQDVDYEALGDYPEGTFDLFPGVNFKDDAGPDFEARLAEDFPATDVPASPSPPAEVELDAPEAPGNQEVLVPSFSNVDLQQLQFTDPMQAYNDAQSMQAYNGAQPMQPTYMPQVYNPMGNNMNPNWPPAPNQNMLTFNPAFSPYPLANQGYPQYIPNIPMGPQINGQQMVQQPMFVPQQPMGNPFINGQQMNQQPMNQGYQIAWQPQQQPNQFPNQFAFQQRNQELSPEPIQQPTQQAIPQPIPHPTPQPVPQPVPQFIPKPVPQKAQESLPEGSSPPVDQRRDSDIPIAQDVSRHSKKPPPPGTITTSPPLKRPATNHHGEALLNDKIPRRTHTNKGPLVIEPERYYGPSPPKPRDWGPIDARGRHLFTYTEKGELAAGLFLSAHEMRQFLLGPSMFDTFEAPPRLPGVKSTRKLRQGLTLWIGWPAAMANSRYPRGGESTKCRFSNCRYHNTIAVGDPWVILDERQNVDGELIDPFHNAGYVHLYCLEYHFDLVELWHVLDIRPDYRLLKRESHPYFALDHKVPGVDERLKQWWVGAFTAWELAKGLGIKRPRAHDTSLANCLILYKIRHEPKGQAKTRQRRGGVDMSKHYGDPELKKKLLTFRKFGLLDENGFPVPGADELLKEMEARVRLQKREKQNFRQQWYPAFQPTYTTAPLFSTQPLQPAATLTHLNQPITPIPTPLPAPILPAGIAGHKRSRDETATEDAMSNGAAGEPPAVVDLVTPPSKRQRVVDTTPAPPQPATQTTPAFNPAGAFAPTGDPDIDMHDPSADVDPQELNEDLDDRLLNQFFGGADAHADSEAAAAAANPEPEPRPPDDGASNSDHASLFG